MTLKQVLKDFPEPLEPADEALLFATHGNDDEQVREHVLLCSVAEGVYYARRCCRQMIADDELVSLVYSALARAIKNYDPVKYPGSRFFAYGKIYIRGEIKREWTRRDVVRNSSSHETMIELDCGDDADEDSMVKTTQPNHPGLHPDATVTEEMDFTEMDLAEMMKHLRPAMKQSLTAREHTVITRYYEKGETFEMIGKRLKVTRQAIEHTHKKALAKIRKYLETRKIV